MPPRATVKVQEEHLCLKCNGLVIQEFDMLEAIWLNRCVNCGGRGEREFSNLTFIRTLAEEQRMARERKEQSVESRRQLDVQRVQVWRANRYSEGLCRNCTQPRLPDGVFCKAHRDDNRRRVKEWNDKKKKKHAV